MRKAREGLGLRLWVWGSSMGSWLYIICSLLCSSFGPRIGHGSTFIFHHSRGSRVKGLRTSDVEVLYRLNVLIDSKVSQFDSKV